MKRFSTSILNETFQNPGNTILKTGVMNHYTPVQNILTNIRNLFCPLLGVVAEIGEDELSIKLSSSQFTSQQKTNEILWRSMYNDVFTYGTSSLQGYITSQGLTKVTTINLGSYYVVYFSPEDIRTAKDPITMEPNAQGCTSTGNYQGECCPVPVETNESLYDEFELNTVTEEITASISKSTDKEPINDIDVKNILNNDNNIVTAKQLNILASDKISLPSDYYFAAVKFKNGDESIALRWKHNKQLPTGNTTESVRSLIHIFNSDKNSAWVQDYANDSIVQLPDSVKDTISKVLQMLGAHETDDPAVFTLSTEHTDIENDNKENTEKDNKENTEKDNKEEDTDKNNKNNKEDDKDKNDK